MAPKILNIIFPLILALNLHLSIPSLAQTDRKASQPVVYITSAFPKGKNLPIVNVQFNVGLKKANVQLNPGQQYHLKVEQPSTKVYGSGVYELQFASFVAYDPARDKSHAVVFWKVDDWGFSISYDNKKWTKVSAWQSE